MGRRLRLVALTLAVAVGVAGCGGDDQVGPGPGPGPPGLTVAEVLGARDDLDEVVTMEPGGTVPVPVAVNRRDGMIGPRHVLRTDGPEGPIDLFEYRTRRIGSGHDLWRCRPMMADDRTENPCTLDTGEPALIGPVFVLDRRSVLALDGPADTTHFVAQLGDRRIAVIPVDSQALLVLAGDPCALDVTVEAWRDGTLLASATPGYC